MITTMRSSQRGAADFGWLQSKHSFSFGSYYNPGQMGFGNLRVINEDIVQPAMGFASHGHRDMEIISYVIYGALEHRDDMDNGSIIRAGDVQRMSAGSGVIHSEFNPSDSTPVHFLQIWILPRETGISPDYQQLHFSRDKKRNRLCPIVSGDGGQDSLRIHQDAVIYASILDKGVSLSRPLVRERRYWLQVAAGSVNVNAEILSPGDAAAVQAEEALTITAVDEAEFLLFDLV